MILNPNKIVVALSGGVDSSVAAWLLKEAGHDVIGITLKLWDAPAGETPKHASCCSVEDIGDARRVADQLDIPFYVINSKEQFRQNVIDNFVQEYRRGRTPNPCAMCNDKVKFEYLHDKAFELGAYSIATGHYAQRHRDEATGLWSLAKGADPKKDQSYFLFSLGQKQLEHTLFPVGHLTKEEVRALATKANLKTRNKPESQEICFVPSGDHGDFIQKYLKNAPKLTGSIVDESGTVLGEHEGIDRYTVGQRRGMQVAAGERVYVKSIDAETRTVTMAKDEALYQSALEAERPRWIQPVTDGTEVTARIRYRHEGSAARVFTQGETLRVEFDEPQRAITPGQVVVFYQGERVLGGAWISRGLA